MNISKICQIFKWCMFLPPRAHLSKNRPSICNSRCSVIPTYFLPPPSGNQSALPIRRGHNHSGRRLLTSYCQNVAVCTFPTSRMRCMTQYIRCPCWRRHDVKFAILLVVQLMASWLPSQVGHLTPPRAFQLHHLPHTSCPTCSQHPTRSREHVPLRAVQSTSLLTWTFLSKNLL